MTWKIAIGLEIQLDENLSLWDTERARITTWFLVVYKLGEGLLPLPTDKWQCPGMLKGPASWVWLLIPPPGGLMSSQWPQGKAVLANGKEGVEVKAEEVLGIESQTAGQGVAATILKGHCRWLINMYCVLD